MPANTFAQFGQSRDSLAALDQHQSQNRQQLDQFQRARQSALQTGDETERLDLEIAILEAAQSDAAVRITQIRNGFQDLATQAFAAPDAVIGTLDTGVPMALLPVRIETRFNGPTQLQLRIYPDQVHIHSHIDAVTEAEAALARTYWSGVWQANGSDAAWTEAATALGPERAKYVLDRFLPPGLAGHDPNLPPDFPDVPTVPAPPARNPKARLLPSRWLVQITGSDNRTLYRGWFDRPVADVLPVSPLGDPMAPPAGNEAAIFTDDPARWMIDFDAAVAAGMATTITLHAGFAGRIARLVVVGVDLSRSPQDAAIGLAAHLRDHGHSTGFGLLKNGTATNNTAQTTSQVQGLARDCSPSLQVAGPLAKPRGADLMRLISALGLPDAPDLFHGLAGTDLAYDASAATVHAALWGSAFGHYFKTILAPVLPDAVQDRLRDHIVTHVRPAGPLATLRVGRQPYGVLPILPRHSLTQDNLPAAFDKALPDLLHLIRTMVATPEALDQIPRIFAQPAGDTSADVMARILKLGPMANRMSLRPAIGPVTRANTETSADRRHYDTVRKILSDLDLNWARLKGHWPLLLDMTLQTRPVIRLKNLPWVLAESDTLPQLVARLTARIANAASDPALISILLNTDGGDAKSLFEGLLLLSGAFEYETAALIHIQPAQADPTGPPLSASETTGLTALPPMTADQIALGNSRMLLQVSGPLTDGQPLLKFIDDQIRQPAPPAAFAGVKAYRDAVDRLVDCPPEDVEHALRGLLDLGSHRLDAFITSVATRRLSDMRLHQPTGLHVGGYGVVHDLTMDTDPDSEGYLHLPSGDHAVTAAILRAGHMANRDDDPQAFAMRLTSDRVRTALAISDGMAQGQPPSALLGYRFERWLTADPMRAKFIGAFRKIAPHPTDRGSPALDQPTDTIAAHDVADGLKLVRLWMADETALLAQVAELSAPLTGPDRKALSDHLTHLAEVFDAFSDLWTTEAVHHLVKGNATRAAAALGVIDRQERPSEALSVQIPRRARGFAQRVFWMADWGAAAVWPSDLASQTSAGANAIAADFLGDPARFVIAVCPADDQGNPIAGQPPVSVPLTRLNLSPLSLLFLSQPERADQLSPLEQRIAAASGLGEISVALLAGPPPDAGIGHIGYGKLLGLLGTLRRCLIGRRPLLRTDFGLPGGAVEDGVEMVALASTASALHVAAQTAAQDLAQSVAPEGLADRAAALRGLGTCAQMFLRLPHPLHPDAPDGAILANARTALANLTRRLADWPALAPADTMADHIARIRLIFGPEFPLLPEITLTPLVSAAWQANIASQTSLHGYTGRGGVTRWRRQMAMVRPPMRALMDALDAAAMTAHPMAGETVTLAQFPHDPGKRWIGLPFDRVDDQLVLTDIALSAVVFGPFNPAATLCGVLIDDWSEAIPARDTATSISFHYDAPASRPPQVILLAATPAADAPWSADMLVNIVNEAVNLARLRLLTPTQIPGAGAILPTVFLPQNLSREMATLDLRAHFATSSTAILGKF